MMQTEINSPDWANKIRERMARGEVEGFFIYSNGGREIDFMKKKKTNPNVLPSGIFRKALALLRRKVDLTMKYGCHD